MKLNLATLAVGALLAGGVNGAVLSSPTTATISHTLEHNKALQICQGWGYAGHTCASAPVACLSGAAPDDPLPTVTRVVGARQRGVCLAGDAPADCLVKATTDCATRAKARGICQAQDPDDACELAAVRRGFCPAADVNAVPHLASCLVFLDLKIKYQLTEHRDEGRRHDQKQAAKPIEGGGLGVEP